MTSNPTVCVIGLGYVGLPLAVELANYYSVIGFDINKTRIEKLSNGTDPNGEVSTEELKKSTLQYTSEEKDIAEADFIIVAVPTPIDECCL